jgi:starch synthase
MGYNTGRFSSDTDSNQYLARRVFKVKKILFVASEAVPFIKTGGLADVVGALPKCFDKEYYDVRVIIPKYLCMKEEYKNQLQYITHFYMDIGYRREYVGIMMLEYEGIKFYFIDNEYYFSGYQPYGDIRFDIEKFAFFSKAALSILPTIEFRPDLIHCHDWQTGLIPVYLKAGFQDSPFYQGIKTVMTIHNLKFQGTWDIKTIRELTGLPAYFFTPDKLEAYKDANLLKGGLVYADAITTVSNTYAEEIKTEFYGEHLDGLMRARSHDLRGIVNGIDYDEYNPETDKLIAKNYNAKNFRKEKVKNKTALQRELGLNEDPKAMMIGVVSRLTDQKGFDLVAYVMDELCQDNIQLVVLGTGEERYENMFRHFAWKYQGKVSANIFYDNGLSHRIYASCDAFLMPSLFEPCGLSQLMSLRYGTLPIVRETGGLKDTVEPYNEYENTGTGFSFRNYNAHEMLATVRYAEGVYYDKKREWNKLVDRAMAKDFSWSSSARQYEEMYNWLIGY